MTRATTVAVRFEDSSDGMTLGMFMDGNRNGVRMRDIDLLIDTPIEAPVRLSDLFAGVTVSLTPEMSRLFSFTPTGTSTSGTVYLQGRHGAQFAVRVLGATGRARVLRYLAARNEWVEAS